MVFDRASTYSAEEPLDIGVRVDPRGKRVTVRFDNGPVTATLGDLIAALNGDDKFAALFSAGFTSCSLAASNNASSAVLGLVAARNVAAGFDDSGRTQFAVEVRAGSVGGCERVECRCRRLIASCGVGGASSRGCPR